MIYVYEYISTWIRIIISSIDLRYPSYFSSTAGSEAACEETSGGQERTQAPWIRRFSRVQLIGAAVEVNKLRRYPQQPQRFIFTNLSEASAKPSAGHTSAGVAGVPWVKWPQILLNLTRLCTEASQTFSGTFSGTLLTLHRSLPDLLRNLLRKPCWTWHGSAPKPSVRFNKVLEKVPEKVWEALVQSYVRFNRVPEKVPEKVWGALVQSQVRFNRVPQKVPEFWGKSRSGSTRFWREGSGAEKGEGLWGFGAEPGQVQQRSREGSGEGVGGFGAEPGQVQQRSREGSGEVLGGSKRFRRRFWRRFRKVLVRPGSTRLQAPIAGVCRRRFSVKLQQISDEKDCESYLLLLLGIPPKLIFF